MGGWSRDRADLTSSLGEVFELFPILQRAASSGRRDLQRRPATDAGHRARAHGQAEAAHAGRAVHGSLAQADVGRARRHQAHPRHGRRRAARRAECQPGPGDGRPGLCPRERQRRPRGPRPRAGPRTTGSARLTWVCEAWMSRRLRRPQPWATGLLVCAGRRFRTTCSGGSASCCSTSWAWPAWVRRTPRSSGSSMPGRLARDRLPSSVPASTPASRLPPGSTRPRSSGSSSTRATSTRRGIPPRTGSPRSWRSPRRSRPNRPTCSSRSWWPMRWLHGTAAQPGFGRGCTRTAPGASLVPLLDAPACSGWTARPRPERSTPRPGCRSRATSPARSTATGCAMRGWVRPTSRASTRLASRQPGWRRTPGRPRCPSGSFLEPLTRRRRRLGWGPAGMSSTATSSGTQRAPSPTRRPTRCWRCGSPVACPT